MLVLSREWTELPPIGTPIGTHPITRNLRAAVFGNANTAYDAVSNKLVSAGAASAAIAPPGVGFSTDGSAQYQYIAGAGLAESNYANGYTLAMLCVPSVRASTFERGLSLRASAYGALYMQLYDSSGNKAQFGYIDAGNGNNYIVCNLPAAAQSGVHLVSASSGLTIATSAIYIDGIAQTTTVSLGMSIAPQTGVTGVDIGRLRYGGVDYYGKYNWIGFSLVWDRVLTAREHAELAARPAIVFE